MDGNRTSILKNEKLFILLRTPHMLPLIMDVLFFRVKFSCWISKRIVHHLGKNKKGGVSIPITSLLWKVKRDDLSISSIHPHPSLFHLRNGASPSIPSPSIHIPLGHPRPLLVSAPKEKRDFKQWCYLLLWFQTFRSNHFYLIFNQCNKLTMIRMKTARQCPNKARDVQSAPAEAIKTSKKKSNRQSTVFSTSKTSHWLKKNLEKVHVNFSIFQRVLQKNVSTLFWTLLCK